MVGDRLYIVAYRGHERGRLPGVDRVRICFGLQQDLGNLETALLNRDVERG
jgi:hypothetical protein